MKWIVRERPKMDRHPTALIAIAGIIILLKTKKVKEPLIILVAAIIGLVLKLSG